MSSEPLTPHDHAAQIVSEVSAGIDLNEADTRHSVIDRIIHDVLLWPRPLVKCEQHISPGYADYIFTDQIDRKHLVLEAKESGVAFTLPSTRSKDLARFVKIKTLRTNPEIMAAMDQVHTYCIKSGCLFAAITNGQQWVFFKCFSHNKDWQSQNAYCISEVSYFDQCFIDATQHFSFPEVTHRNSLESLLGRAGPSHRSVFFPRDQVIGYDHQVTSNFLAPALRPFVDRYFGVMKAADFDFMARCYVHNKEYDESARGMTQLISDSLSPYFAGKGVRDFFGDKKGGAFGDRLAQSVSTKKAEDVIVLFGGKGAGKSTFINKVLFHNPPNGIEHFSRISVVDLLKCIEDRERIEDETWRQLIAGLDTENLLSQNRGVLLDLFRDRFEVAAQQDLAGLPVTSEPYNLLLNGLVAAWKADREYVAKRLSEHWRSRRKGCVVVLDNTDQFTPPVQEFCFTLANRIAQLLDCLVVISMREERFHHSRVHGTLDAFQNSGFHLSSPSAGRLFVRRCVYVLKLLRNKERARAISPELNDEVIGQLHTINEVFLRQFAKRDVSPLRQFIEACAHGNMRIALELFREFSLSGYLRVEELLNEPNWSLLLHQVLRPMMVPDRLFYDEDKSKIPNLLKVRSEENGSHFTGIRLLDMLLSKGPETAPQYVPLAEILAKFSDVFNMLTDVERTLDVYLRRGIVEANNRLDLYSKSIDSIKITPFGRYLRNTLASNWSYLELISLDCGVHDQRVAEVLAYYGRHDRDCTLAGKKMERLAGRITKARVLLDYLRNEEDIENQNYPVDGFVAPVMEGIRAGHAEDEVRVIKSASNRYGGIADMVYRMSVIERVV